MARPSPEARRQNENSERSSTPEATRDELQDRVNQMRYRIERIKAISNSFKGTEVENKKVLVESFEQRLLQWQQDYPRLREDQRLQYLGQTDGILARYEHAFLNKDAHYSPEKVQNPQLRELQEKLNTYLFTELTHREDPMHIDTALAGYCWDILDRKDASPEELQKLKANGSKIVQFRQQWIEEQNPAMRQKIATEVKEVTGYGVSYNFFFKNSLPDSVLKGIREKSPVAQDYMDILKNRTQEGLPPLPLEEIPKEFLSKKGLWESYVRWGIGLRKERGKNFLVRVEKSDQLLWTHSAGICGMLVMIDEKSGKTACIHAPPSAPESYANDPKEIAKIRESLVSQGVDPASSKCILARGTFFSSGADYQFLKILRQCGVPNTNISLVQSRSDQLSETTSRYGENIAVYRGSVYRADQLERHAESINALGSVGKSVYAP